MNTLRTHWLEAAFLGLLFVAALLVPPLAALVAVAGMAGAVLMLLVRLFTKKSKKIPAIMLASCFTLFVVAALVHDSADATKPLTATDSSSETVTTPPPAVVAKDPEVPVKQEAVETPEPQPVEPATEPDPETVARNAFREGLTEIGKKSPRPFNYADFGRMYPAHVRSLLALRARDTGAWNQYGIDECYAPAHDLLNFLDMRDIGGEAEYQAAKAAIDALKRERLWNKLIACANDQRAKHIAGTPPDHMIRGAFPRLTSTRIVE